MHVTEGEKEGKFKQTSEPQATMSVCGKCVGYATRVTLVIMKLGWESHHGDLSNDSIGWLG